MERMACKDTQFMHKAQILPSLHFLFHIDISNSTPYWCRCSSDSSHFWGNLPLFSVYNILKTRTRFFRQPCPTLFLTYIVNFGENYE